MILALLAFFGRDLFALTQSQHIPWASITFSGTRHEIELITYDANLETAEIERKCASLSENVFALRGHILADIVASYDGTDTRKRLKIEALTVESA